MNLTVFLVVLTAGFISGVLSIKYVSDSRKVSLLAWFAAAGIVLGLLIPPQFNQIVFLTAVTFGGVSVLSRLTSDVIDRYRVGRAAREILGE